MDVDRKREEMKWIDGSMDGLIDRWMDGWMDGYMDGLIDRCIDGWMDILKD